MQSAEVIIVIRPHQFLVRGQDLQQERLVDVGMVGGSNKEY
jgi:hypothetical protein